MVVDDARPERGERRCRRDGRRRQRRNESSLPADEQRRLSSLRPSQRRRLARARCLAAFAVAPALGPPNANVEAPPATCAASRINAYRHRQPRDDGEIVAWGDALSSPSERRKSPRRTRTRRPIRTSPGICPRSIIAYTAPFVLRRKAATSSTVRSSESLMRGNSPALRSRHQCKDKGHRDQPGESISRHNPTALRTASRDMGIRRSTSDVSLDMDRKGSRAHRGRSSRTDQPWPGSLGS